MSETVYAFVAQVMKGQIVSLKKLVYKDLMISLVNMVD